MSITYLKNVQWYRYQYTESNANKVKNLIELFKSKEYLIVNKPYDLICANVSAKKSESLVSMLTDKYPQYYDPTVTNGFRLLQNIDSLASGCICISLTTEANRLANKALMQKNASNYYLALANGHIDSGKDFMINASIGEDANNKGHSMCTKFDRDGNLNRSCINEKEAQTWVRVLEHGTYNGKPCTKVLLKTLKGHRHQIRVHLSYFGHPIIGDITYGSDHFDVYRTMLHAYMFSMKIDKKDIKAIAEDPFTNEIDKLWKPETVIEKLDNILS